MRRFTAVTTKALTLTSSELLQPIPKSHNPLTGDNLNSSSNLCFGIPTGYFCLQPKCLYIFVCPCITHNIYKCSFLVLYQMNIQYFLLCCMGVRGEQILWMFDMRHRAQYLHLTDMKWQNSHSKGTHKSVRFTEYIRMIMNNAHYDCYTKLS